MNVNCSKCAKRLEVLSMVEGDRQFMGETWSGRIEPFPEKVWYNVAFAKKTLAACPPIPFDLLEDVSVEMLWDTQVSKSEVITAHLDHVDLTDPILLVTTHRNQIGQDYVTLVDGNHRVARAHRDRIPSLKAIRLGIEFSRALLVDPWEAVLNELLVEIVETGGKINYIEGNMIIVGGKPAPSTADDHPYRAKLLATILSGITVLDLPRQGR